MRPISIAIDGPAASGKSTIGGLLAKRLGYTYIDTGAMYRAVTCVALHRGIPIGDEAAITRLAQGVKIEITNQGLGDGRQYTVLADGQDITWDIRSPEVNAEVSIVSAYSGVRRALVARQREMAAEGRVVMVGRDISTVVLPDAEAKIYLDASREERARRRYLEARGRGSCISLKEVVADLTNRDRIDSTRGDSPLTVAADAFVIDSSDMEIEAVVERAMAIVASVAENA